jgi:hypothetical protein
MIGRRLRTLMRSGAAVYLTAPQLSQRLGMSLLSDLQPKPGKTK